MADQSSCCSKAATYVSGITENFTSSFVPSSEQCQSNTYNNTDPQIELFEPDTDSSGKQYVLYSALKFTCTGCISKVLIYSKAALLETHVFRVQTWSTKQESNQTVLNLRNQITLELSDSDSVPVGDDFFTNSKEVNDTSLCFEEGDVFGIETPANFIFLVRKNSSNSVTYARIPPNCDSLNSIYYLENIVSEPLVAVEVTQSATAISTGMNN